MRLLCLLLLSAPMLACETMQLYEGDRDGFARLVEVMEPVDIRPNDRRAAVLPPVMGQPLAPPANSPRMPSALPEPSIPAPGNLPAPPKALPMPGDTAEPGSLAMPLPPTTQPGAPANPPKLKPKSPANGPSATLPRRSDPMPAAARLAKRPIAKEPAKLSLEDPQASTPEPLSAHKAKTSLQREPTFQPPPTKPRTKLPEVPAPPLPRAHRSCTADVRKTSDLALRARILQSRRAAPPTKLHRRMAIALRQRHHAMRR